MSYVNLVKMDGQPELGPTQQQSSAAGHLRLNISNLEKNGARYDSPLTEVVEQEPNGPLTDSPMDPDLERELFGSSPNSPVPQLDGSVLAAEQTTIPENSKDDPSSLYDGAANETVPIAGHDANDDDPGVGAALPAVAEEPVASTTFAQDTAVVEIPTESNGVEPQQMHAKLDEKASAAALMPPPAAPASMLPQLQPSSKAKDAAERIEDQAVIGRLIAVCVILFRQGGGANVKKLAQFTIDLIGKQKWDEELPVYMQAEPLPSDDDAVIPLLEETVENLKPLDEASSAFLEGMLYAWN